MFFTNDAIPYWADGRGVRLKAYPRPTAHPRAREGSTALGDVIEDTSAPPPRTRGFHDVYRTIGTLMRQMGKIGPIRQMGKIGATRQIMSIGQKEQIRQKGPVGPMGQMKRIRQIESVGPMGQK